MSTVKVKQVLRRYHLKPVERDLQPHLNQLTETILRDHLDSVLLEAGIAASELVCIKELRLAMYYERNKSDFEIIELWRKALLKSVYQQLGRRNPVALIRYPSEVEAIKSVARSLAAGQIDHQWAWRQIGITDGNSADLPQVKGQWLAYLAAHPQMLLPVMKGLMTEGTFIKLLERKVLSAQELIQLTDIATIFLSLEINWPGIIAPQQEVKEQTGALKKIDVWATKAPAKGLLMALLRTFQASYGSNLWPAQNIAETGLQAAAKTALAKVLFWAVMQSDSNQMNRANPSKKAIESNLLLVWQALNREQPKPAGGQKSQFNSVDNLQVPAPQTGGAESPDKGSKEFFSDEELICGQVQNKQSLLSQYGGLLFLLNRLKQQEVLVHLQQPQLARHSLPWLLENFSWLLLPECKGDASVKVFSGRLFEKHSSDEIDEPISDDEKLLLHHIADEFKQQIIISLRGHGLHTPQKNIAGDNLFADMCRRKARIEAQPGWVNVFFELRSVDTAVRAAGLDLDPDYLPWLAYVVKFYYE